MERRRFLAGVSTAIAGAGAGCTSTNRESSMSESPSPVAASVNPADIASTLSDGDEFKDTFELPKDGTGEAVATISLLVQLRPIGSEEDVFGSGQVTVTNQTTGEELYTDEVYPSYQPGDSRLVEAVDTGEVWGDTVEVRFEAYRSDDLEWRFSYGGTVISN